MKTTEGEEVELPHLLITDALAFHVLRGYSGSEWDEALNVPTSPVPSREGPGAPSS
jgi:hypothetical protein